MSGAGVLLAFVGSSLTSIFVKSLKNTSKSNRTNVLIGSGCSYYCMSCGTKHDQSACPKCGSKMKRVGS